SGETASANGWFTACVTVGGSATIVPSGATVKDVTDPCEPPPATAYAFPPSGLNATALQRVRTSHAALPTRVNVFPLARSETTPESSATSRSFPLGLNARPLGWAKPEI